MKTEKNQHRGLVVITAARKKHLQFMEWSIGSWWLDCPKKKGKLSEIKSLRKTPTARVYLRFILKIRVALPLGLIATTETGFGSNENRLITWERVQWTCLNDDNQLFLSAVISNLSANICFFNYLKSKFHSIFRAELESRNFFRIKWHFRYIFKKIRFKKLKLQSN